MTPFTAALLPFHAGQAARAEMDRYDADQAELVRHGRDVLTRTTPARLAHDLHAAVLALQLEGKLGEFDTDVFEDLAAELAAAENVDTQESPR